MMKASSSVNAFVLADTRVQIGLRFGGPCVDLVIVANCTMIGADEIQEKDP
jgi:hypothetical protein